MDKFIKFGDDYVNLKFVKSAKFTGDACSVTIANTKTVSVGNGSYEYYRELDDTLVIHDKAICDQVREMFKARYVGHR